MDLRDNKPYQDSETEYEQLLVGRDAPAGSSNCRNRVSLRIWPCPAHALAESPCGCNAAANGVTIRGCSGRLPICTAPQRNGAKSPQTGKVYFAELGASSGFHSKGRWWTGRGEDASWMRPVIRPPSPRGSRLSQQGLPSVAHGEAGIVDRIRLVRVNGNRKLRTPLVGLLGAGAVGGAEEPLSVNPQKLRGYPLCEASAAISPGRGRILVGDNTVPDKLFPFDIENGGLKPSRVDHHSLGGGVSISDIEALTMLENGDVMVLGSHSRNSKCRPKKKRRRFLRGQLTDGGFKASNEGVVTMKERISCSGLFGDRPLDGSLLTSVCERLESVEQAADEIWDAEWSSKRKIEKCREEQPFNVEAPVTATNDGREEVWVGLRSPLLPNASEADDPDRAILLRLRRRGGFEFDAVALINFDGDGIRGLAFSDGWVFGIAGPSNYGEGDFKLWKFRSHKLRSKAVITPKVLLSLRAETSPEGIVVIGSTAHVVFDGDRGAKTCDNSAGYWAFPLSP